MTTKAVLERTTTDPQVDNISADIGLLVIRVVFGLLMAVHGSQKLFGWFKGPGWQANADGFELSGYNPGKVFGTLAGLTELGGGLMLAVGLLTPLAGAIILGTMINAINTLWSFGLFGNDTYEMPLLYAAIGAAIAFTGPGRFSLDHGRPWQRHGVVWGAGAVALAVVAAVLTLILKWVL
ncbi:DoxX family membrane protein [Nocardia brasiliensis]|uniref:DoxX family membrane protein n=1 Tax=Nocardia brasiliensis TaxID=37326 RepID=A0A6G9XM98_NOCBR|nr:DoxX family protein [Nocardia brasiliensis]QIS01980.1 DoxX family membrane protein [Nocardia brasiliensis]